MYNKNNWSLRKKYREMLYFKHIQIPGKKNQRREGRRLNICDKNFHQEFPANCRRTHFCHVDHD